MAHRTDFDTRLAERYKPKAQAGIGRRLGNFVFAVFHDYSRAESDEFKFWEEIWQYTAIDGKVYDTEWIKNREKELRDTLKGAATSSDVRIWAYARARLEDFNRHQGRLPDGRVAAQIPAYGATRDKLLELGLEVDNFKRDSIRIDNETYYTVILPLGWSLKIAGEGEVDPVSLMRIRNSERSAAVVNEAGERMIDIGYIQKPFGYGDDTKAWSYIISPGQAPEV